MKYIVMEIQKASDGTISNVVLAYDDLNAAYNKYYTVLAAAAISSVAVHSAVLLNETGFCIKHDFFEHVEVEVSDPE